MRACDGGSLNALNGQVYIVTVSSLGSARGNETQFYKGKQNSDEISILDNDTYST